MPRSLINQPASETAALLKTHPLKYYVAKYRGHFSVGMLFLILTNTLDALSPLVLRKGIDQIVDGISSDELLKTSALYFLILVMLAGTRYTWRVFFGRYHTSAAEDLRNRIFQHLSRMGPQFFRRNPIGELMSIITNDVQSFRNGIGSGVLVLVDGFTIVLVVLPVMIWMEPNWTWKTLILLPLVPFLIWQVTGMIFRSYKIQQDKLSDLSGVTQEIASGIRVIKGFAQEENQLKYYNLKSKDYTDACNKVATVDSLFVPIMYFGVATGTAILLFISADDLIAGSVSVGTFVAFQRYITKMVWPMTAFGMGLSQFQKGMASFSRIKDLLLKKTDIPDEGNIVLNGFYHLRVKNLSFQYADASSPILKNINFEINKGEKVGIVGPVGSGKTTLLHVLNRLFPVDPGMIEMNGHSIEQITQKSLHQTIAFVPQEPFLFSDSISDNIQMALDEPVLDDELLHWTDAVDLKSEIMSLPQAFGAQLGERGVNLSGGQKQRLTIARGLITKAPLIVLDDSLSAVDHKTEATIQNQLKNQLEKKTQIIVTHRLSAIRDADKIIVLKDGEIEAIGTHDELILKSSAYKQIADIQGGQHE